MSNEKIYNNFEIEKPFGAYGFANDSISYKSRVLDLGCATGSFGAYLFYKRKCEVVGVDFSKEQLEICQSRNAYQALYQIDLNNINTELDEYKHYFDTIVITDVIEHLTTPEKLLSKLQYYLKENGNIIISVPNVNHLSVKLSLLLGEFNYQETGILDESHVKFYTARTIIALLNKFNFQITNISVIAKKLLTEDESLDLSLLPEPIIDFVLNTPCAKHYQYAFNVKISDNDVTNANNIWLEQIYQS